MSDRRDEAVGVHLARHGSPSGSHRSEYGGLHAAPGVKESQRVSQVGDRHARQISFTQARHNRKIQLLADVVYMNDTITGVCT